MWRVQLCSTTGTDFDYAYCRPFWNVDSSTKCQTSCWPSSRRIRWWNRSWIAASSLTIIPLGPRLAACIAIHKCYWILSPGRDRVYSLACRYRNNTGHAYTTRSPRMAQSLRSSANAISRANYRCPSTPSCYADPNCALSNDGLAGWSSIYSMNEYCCQLFPPTRRLPIPITWAVDNVEYFEVLRSPEHLVGW